jgi:sugar phosphate isomerase/epimerase
MIAQRNGVSIRDQIVPAQTGGPFADAIRWVGADSIECAVDADGSVASLGGSLNNAEAIARLSQQAERFGVCISALLLAADFSADIADANVEWAAQMVQAAAALDVPVVRIDPWTANHAMLQQTVIDNFINRAGELLRRTADTGVDLGVENHGQIFNDPRVLDAILSALPDKRFGLTLDTGNLYWWGHTVDEVYKLIERYAPRAKHTHIKNINYPPELAHSRREVGFEYKKYCSPLADGNLDLKRIVHLLRQHGYRRPLCVEDESLFKVPEDEKLDVLRQDVQALHDCFP